MLYWFVEWDVSYFVFFVSNFFIGAKLTDWWVWLIFWQRFRLRCWPISLPRSITLPRKRIFNSSLFSDNVGILNCACTRESVHASLTIILLCICALHYDFDLNFLIFWRGGLLLTSQWVQHFIMSKRSIKRILVLLIELLLKYLGNHRNVLLPSLLFTPDPVLHLRLHLAVFQ